MPRIWLVIAAHAALLAALLGIAIAWVWEEIEYRSSPAYDPFPMESAGLAILLVFPVFLALMVALGCAHWRTTGHRLIVLAADLAAGVAGVIFASTIPPWLVGVIVLLAVIASASVALVRPAPQYPSATRA